MFMKTGTPKPTMVMVIATTTIASRNENPLGTDLSVPSQPIRFQGIFVGSHVLRLIPNRNRRAVSEIDKQAS